MHLYDFFSEKRLNIRIFTSLNNIHKINDLYREIGDLLR
jgi:hypothetical protein